MTQLLGLCPVCETEMFFADGLSAVMTRMHIAVTFHTQCYYALEYHKAQVFNAGPAYVMPRLG